MESLKSAISNILPGFADAIVEHVVYPFQVNTKIRELESATRDMVAMKEDVKTDLESAMRKNSAPTKQVIEWLRKMEVAEREAKEIQEKNLKRHHSVLSNYTTSKSAAKKLRDIKSLCDQRVTIEASVHLPPPLSQEIPAYSPSLSNLELALRYVKDDVHGIIGVWGMGGVGKTHLLKQINNELSKDSAFDVVLFVTCSRECFEEKVRNEIINKLGLHKRDDMEQKRSTIHKFFSQRSFVLLLDDLWNRVDLETIGIPKPTMNRKVVVTTRSTEVCGQMEVRKKIKVDILGEHDAWSLFEEKVSEETINSDPLIQKCAVEVLNELGRFPLAVITVGRAMHDKLEPNEWERAVVLLKQARLYDVEFSGSMSVFQILRFSYDSLKDDILKQCFLLCALWPEDYWIKKKNLIEIWMGLGLIDEPEICIAYSTGYSYIRRLLAVCLLEEAGVRKKIKMHDVIRDMALWIANNHGADRFEWIVHAGTYKGQPIEVLRDTKNLSLMHSKTKKVSLSMPGSSTKLSTLLLNDNWVDDSKIIKLELFCELTVLDLSNNNLEAFPIEICKLVHLRFLNLSENRKLKSLPNELNALINLRYLLLRGIVCSIPEGVLSKLKVLRVLDSNCIHCGSRTEQNSGTVAFLEQEMKCLSNFQALGITMSTMNDLRKLSQANLPVRWLEFDNLEKEDCFSFTNCLPESSQLQSSLCHLSIKGSGLVWVKFERTDNYHKDYSFARLEKLCFIRMEDMKGVVWNGLSPKDVFPRLQVLHLIGCDKLTTVSWVYSLPCIRELRVYFCSSIKKLIHFDELISGEFMVSQPSFPFLKKMLLWQNEELESISDPVVPFSGLEFLEVDRCNKLKKLPFKTDDPPKKLKVILGSEEWWSAVEMDGTGHRSSLQRLFPESVLNNCSNVLHSANHD